MKALLIDPQTVELAEYHERQFRTIYSQVVSHRQAMRKQGRVISYEELDTMFSFSSALKSLWESVFFYSQSKDSLKVVELCLILIKQVFINHKPNCSDKSEDLLRTYISQNIVFLSQQQKINTYTKLISFYRRLGQKEELITTVRELLNVAMMEPPSKGEKEKVRQLTLEAYEELIVNLDTNQGLDVWEQFVRYELRQQQPDYQYLLKIVHRHYPQSRMQIPLYLLLGKHDHARQALECFRIRDCKKYMVSAFEKAISLWEKGDVAGLQKLHHDEISKFKLNILNVVMKKLMKTLPKSQVKRETRQDHISY